METGGKKEKLPTKEEQIELCLRPLRQIVECKAFENFGDHATFYWIMVEWHEPQKDGGEHKFTASGPLNNRFLDWARKHYDFWLDKAHVPLNVLKVERTEELMQKGSRGW